MEQNKELSLAMQYVEQTGVNLFLTGKAGTGKTTFLRRLKERSPKRMIVVAPTGVAAINAGGVTIHSFFQLPFSPFVPDATFASAREQYKMSREKRNIMRTLDLLVIDEISMVRSDLLDAIDSVLRKYREPSQPFGGVQLLMIGDLQQLSPVVKDEEQELLSRYYDTPYFFGSRALQQTQYVTIELQKVYRQADERFVSLLNCIRENRIDRTVADALNARYLPDFHPDTQAGYIRLTTHNYRAQQYNEGELAALRMTAYTFKASIEGTFPEYSYPTEAVLTLKVGAQVMFVKNDPTPAHRFYNGRIGHVTLIDKQTVHVHCPGDDADIIVEPLEWQNTKYVLDADTKEIREDVEGVFRQLPLRLAWAITIHKSQGLTFEHAIIDANAAFAHGQVYVALSRCKSLEGLVLASPISPDAVITDDAVNRFVNQELAQAGANAARLEPMKQAYFEHLLNELFDFDTVRQKLAYVSRLLDEYFYKTYPQLLREYKETLPLFQAKIEDVAAKFRLVCQQQTPSVLMGEDFAKRITSGADYFKRTLDEMLTKKIDATMVETDNKDLKKRFRDALDELRQTFHVKVAVLALTADHGFSTSTYLKDKELTILNVAETKKPRKTKAAVEKMELPADITQPELYKRLRTWRAAKAEGMNVPAYVVLLQKALLCMVNYMPADERTLLEIPYFGKVSAEKYGMEILDIINQYVSETGVERPEPVFKKVVKKKEKTEKIDSKVETLMRYKSGKTVLQICQERGLTEDTILNHLLFYVQQGTLPVSDFVSPDKMVAVRAAISLTGKGASLGTIKASCPDDISYADIRFTMAHDAHKKA